MSIKLADNISYSGKKPDFERQQYATLADMRAVASNSMPELYLAYCLEDRSLYLYDKSNEDDPVLGKFRKFSAGEGIQRNPLPEPGPEYSDKIYQYVGVTGRYTRGYFYECVLEESERTVIIDGIASLSQGASLAGTEAKLFIAGTSGYEEIRILERSGIGYFVKDGVAYASEIRNISGVGLCVSVNGAEPYITDEGVASLGLSYEAYSAEWVWRSIAVSPGGGSVETISLEEVDELF